jgi:hypothetical protein
VSTNTQNGVLDLKKGRQSFPDHFNIRVCLGKVGEEAGRELINPPLYPMRQCGVEDTPKIRAISQMNKVIVPMKEA